MRFTARKSWAPAASLFAALFVAALQGAAGFAAAHELPITASGSENQLGLTFSPDGNTAFWAEWDGEWGTSSSERTIYTSQRADGRWTGPVPVAFSRGYIDDDPFVSPDGQWLYFVSDRLLADSDDKRDANIWRYRFADRYLEYLSINSDAEEYSPIVTASGALYFASSRDGGFGQGDIYRAAPDGEGFATPENLGPAINSATGEWNVWVSADESELIIEASSRSTNVSDSGDLYYSWRTPAGWSAAIPIDPLNTKDSDLMPRLHPDGETLYYTTAPMGGYARVESAAWPPIRDELRGSYAPDLLVANRSSHEVTFVDLARGEVTERIETGAGPHLLSNVSDGRVIATGYGEFPRPHDEPVSSRPPFVTSINSRFTVIDIERRIVALDRELQACTKPHASWIVGTRAFVTCEPEQQVLVLDVEDGRELSRVDTGQQGAHVLGFEPQSGKLVVSNTDSGSITIIDVNNGDTVVVPLGNGSEGSLVRNGRVWVGNGMAGSISIAGRRCSNGRETHRLRLQFPYLTRRRFPGPGLGRVFRIRGTRRI